MPFQAGVLLLVLSVGQDTKPPVRQVEPRVVVLQSAVRRHCLTTPCLVSIGKKAAAIDVIERLQTIAPVKAALPDDFEYSAGATKAYREKRATIVELSSFRFIGKKRAKAEVLFIDTGLSSFSCSYLVELAKDKWTVDASQIACTIT